MIDKKLDKRLQELTKKYTNDAKKVAEEFGVKLDVAVKLNLQTLKDQGASNGGN